MKMIWFPIIEYIDLAVILNIKSHFKFYNSCHIRHHSQYFCHHILPVREESFHHHKLVNKSLMTQVEYILSNQHHKRISLFSYLKQNEENLHKLNKYLYLKGLQYDWYILLYLYKNHPCIDIQQCTDHKLLLTQLSTANSKIGINLY